MFFLQAEDGIRDLVRARGLGDVYKRQVRTVTVPASPEPGNAGSIDVTFAAGTKADEGGNCLLYTSDAADERSSVDLGGRRIIKKKKMRQ